MTTEARHILDPAGEDAATMNSWSDRAPATVVKRTAKTVWVQEDRVQNMSSEESRESGLTFARGHGDVTIFVRDYDSPIRRYTLRKNGRWMAAGAPMNSRGSSLSLGRRDYYRDPHF
jgi:hypothetical protein